jgi:hypothetical protein
MQSVVNYCLGGLANALDTRADLNCTALSTTNRTCLTAGTNAPRHQSYIAEAQQEDLGGPAAPN